ncbi:hypothetical protein KIPB_002037 [Kipferlia bialata]|uniref:Uncharacterized protein n=1 Tax=Kipferlia bialata TaxID=797122 RepID=A0A9K3CRQ1_9EUKA|nr:hypothetical protein KIPB_002037 [Kipferlia bialata]|eukprot:g2037.t1
MPDVRIYTAHYDGNTISSQQAVSYSDVSDINLNLFFTENGDHNCFYVEMVDDPTQAQQPYYSCVYESAAQSTDPSVFIYTDYEGSVSSDITGTMDMSYVVAPLSMTSVTLDCTGSVDTRDELWLSLAYCDGSGDVLKNENVFPVPYQGFHLYVHSRRRIPT